MRVTFSSFVCLHAALALALTATAAAGQSPAAPATQAPATPPSTLERVDVQAATLSLRYKINETNGRTLTANQLQESALLKVRVSADRARRFSLVAGAGTGSSFTSSWNNTGVGTGEAHHADLFLKQLYATAAPAASLEMQGGGLYLLRGEATEITGYDNDGFVVGGRVSLRAPRQLFFDEVAVTVGDIGDTAAANVFGRFEQMRDFDYRHVLVTRRFSNAVAASLDYTRHGEAETFRQAIVFRSKAMRVVDVVRLEHYERVTEKRDSGFAVQADKSVSRTLALGGGYADIDPFHGGLNGDKYVTGRRVFASATVSVAPALTASAFVTRAVANDFVVANGTRVDIMLSYNVLRSLRP